MSIKWDKPIRAVKTKVPVVRNYPHIFSDDEELEVVQFDKDEYLFLYYQNGTPWGDGPELENYEPEADVTEATVDWTKEIEVHDGDNVFPARLITTDRLDPTNKATHIVLYTDTDGCEYVCAAREDGTSVYRKKFVKNKPKHTVGWINVFRGGSGDRIASNIYFDKDKAEAVGKRLTTYLKTVRVEWDE